mgnify:CR=1 FL=1
MDVIPFGVLRALRMPYFNRDRSVRDTEALVQAAAILHKVCHKPCHGNASGRMDCGVFSSSKTGFVVSSAMTVITTAVSRQV